MPRDPEVVTGEQPVLNPATESCLVRPIYAGKAGSMFTLRWKMF
jgi:hypothetical protein